MLLFQVVSEKKIVLQEGETGSIEIVSNLPIALCDGVLCSISVQINVPGFQVALAPGNCKEELQKEKALVMSPTSCSVSFTVRLCVVCVVVLSKFSIYTCLC